MAFAKAVRFDSPPQSPLPPQVSKRQKVESPAERRPMVVQEDLLLQQVKELNQKLSPEGLKAMCLRADTPEMLGEPFTSALKTWSLPRGFGIVQRWRRGEEMDGHLQADVMYFMRKHIPVPHSEREFAEKVDRLLTQALCALPNEGGKQRLYRAVATDLPMDYLETGYLATSTRNPRKLRCLYVFFPEDQHARGAAIASASTFASEREVLFLPGIRVRTMETYTKDCLVPCTTSKLPMIRLTSQNGTLQWEDVCAAAFPLDWKRSQESGEDFAEVQRVCVAALEGRSDLHVGSVLGEFHRDS